ncbi:MAG: SDR family NAD(P)-dependent oxidoreductase [Alphaproteobacteria bacterium]
MIARGHQVHRINLHFGDQLFWRLPATNFRGPFDDWRAFIAARLERHGITDLVLHGDRRPYHIVAAEEARARGIAVFATDLGYVRPDWITLEYDGMTTYSRFPRDPEAIRSLAAKVGPPDLEPRFWNPFWQIASLDVAYNCGLVFGRPLFPRYRYHSTVHPFAEYVGWLCSRARRVFTQRAANAEKARLQQAAGSYFLVPLQLATDYQIRAHSPFRDGREAVREIIGSFARSGGSRQLVFVAHPFDNGLIPWDRVIGRLAREFGIAGRILSLPGGTPSELLRNAAGVVTINSTIGITALYAGVPVKALGNAVFDVPGLTCQAPLDRFWDEPQPPDPDLMAAFLRALIGTTQVKGGYYERASQTSAIAGFIDRLENRPYPLPQLTAADFAARPPRLAVRTVVVAGVSNGLGLALARAHAGPGIRIVLLGTDATVLEQAGIDCRHRGALVETFCALGVSVEAICGFLDVADRRAPIDDLLVQVDAAMADGSGVVDTNFGPAMDVVARLADPMRRRGRGSVVLLSGLAGRSAHTEKRAALASRSALIEHGAALRGRLSGDGVTVTVVVPGTVALRSAARLDAPHLAELAIERIGEAIGHGLRRRREVVSIPGAAVTARRTARELFRRVRRAMRDAVPKIPEQEPPPTPLAGKSAGTD